LLGIVLAAAAFFLWPTIEWHFFPTPEKEVAIGPMSGLRAYVARMSEEDVHQLLSLDPSGAIPGQFRYLVPMPPGTFRNTRTSPLPLGASATAAIEGSDGAKIDARVQTDNFPVLPKNKGDAFSNPALGELLTRESIDRVFLAGVHTTGCVLATARGAVRRGYGVAVLSQCVASRSSRATRRALEKMAKLGVEIVSQDRPWVRSSK
jgi:nicotinamidase-related amidase